jgi:hypothetical protein
MSCALSRVVEHLAYHFASQAGISAALDLDQGRKPGFVHEQMVQTPSIGALLLAWHAELAGDEHESVEPFIAGDQVRVFREEALKDVFRVVRDLRHRRELAVVFQIDDGHH